jgi:hypothetical protein
MFKYLFFDDQKLFDRDNVERQMGKPSLVGLYNDGVSTTAYASPWVFKTEDGRYRMIYQGEIDLDDFNFETDEDKKGTKNGIFFKEEKSLDKEDNVFKNNKKYLFSAISDDGINFVPEDVTDKVYLCDRVVSNQIMYLPDGEVGSIYEDLYSDPSERYKMLFSWYDMEKNNTIHDEVFVSPDLFNWKKLEGINFHNGWTEPLTSVFYNQHKKCHTILCRPHAGVRRYGYIETTDWREFTPHRMCMQVDSLDEPLAEMYGLQGFDYDGWYVGMPIIYGEYKRGLYARGDGGTLKAHLAYSLDGNHWHRSLREPFLRGDAPEDVSVLGYENKMLWPMSMIKDKNGDLLIYAGATRLEHGEAFHVKGGTAIHIYKLRKDGFICLKTDKKEDLSSIATRENIWNGGDLHINLKAEEATVAIYESTGEWFKNINGECHLVEGYSHEDSVSFSGDSTDWVVAFKNGKTLDRFIGKTIVIEIKFKNGEVYSVFGDCVPVMNVEAGYYRNFGVLPEKSQFGIL